MLLVVNWGIYAAVLALSARSRKLSLTPQIQADRVICEIKRVALLLVSRAERP